MCQSDNTGTSMILTSATLVRSLNGDNNMIPDVKVKVLLSDGHITDGHIFLVDFHYNVAVVKVAANLAHLEVFHLKGPTHNGSVLALGRAYEGGSLMCSRGQVVNQTSIFGCSALFVSSCKISMAGSGGPLVNYNGQVLGVNFYEKNQTSHLPMLIVSRILEQNQSYGKTISPWLGLKYTSLQTMPLRVLERIYQKFPDVDQGLYISDLMSVIFGGTLGGRFGRLWADEANSDEDEGSAEDSPARNARGIGSPSLSYLHVPEDGDRSLGSRGSAAHLRREEKRRLQREAATFLRSGYSASCALDSLMGVPSPGGAAGAHGFWMQPAVDGCSGLLFPGYWMATH